MSRPARGALALALALAGGSSLAAADPGGWASASASAAAPPAVAPSQPSVALLGATTTKWPIDGGAALSLRVPDGSLAMTQDLPAVDLSSVPDARIALRRGVGRAPATPEHASDSVTAVCVTAPSSRWAPEAEPLVFSKMADAARAELAKHGAPSRFDVGDPVDDGAQSVAKVSAEAPVADGAAAQLRTRLEGRLLLGFVGERADVVACVVACVEVSFPAARVCPAAVEGVKLDGPLVARPASSFGARLGASVTARPGWAALSLLGALAVVGGLLLAAWPPRKRHAAPADVG
ncbi:MAG: hypothetical protein IT374_11455 [Polyangiaceae bacterium]|nr:hypothetical protein [Polyangiaceae bacterium]